VERYKSGLIAYSLGDFVFHHQGESRKSMLLTFCASQYGVEDVKIAPVLLSDHCQPMPINAASDPETYSAISNRLVNRIVKPESDTQLEKCLFAEGQFNVTEAVAKGFRNFGSYPLLYYWVGFQLLLRRVFRKGFPGQPPLRE
jgi:hypothetical protein